MANELAIIIDGIKVKELRCKNDNCRRLIGYEKIQHGIFIFTCPNCGTISKFQMDINYQKHAKDFMEDLQKKVNQEGGE